jgi:aminopeptidase N
MRLLRVLPALSALSVLSVLSVLPAMAQGTTPFTHADSLKGSLTAPERTWWDVTFYDLHVKVNPADSSISGWNGITYTVVGPTHEMQIDLQAPLGVDSMVQAGKRLKVRQDGNAWFATVNGKQKRGESHTLTVYYHGRPTVAKRPPWDGGFTWGQDSLGKPWIVTTDQGIGASIWWPNKDIQAEEPDSQRIAITMPDPLVDVSNGRLRSVEHHADGTTTWEWFDTNPINNYAIVINAGDYIHYSEIFRGENGPLTLDYWPLSYHLDAARHTFAQAPAMLSCFEHWFGAYPWYEDGYKLIEVSHNGMEHQSAVAYGNGFTNGYHYRNPSRSIYGNMFDFIIVHESAHEWWGNNITAKDNADMWVHESFANYAENLYVECRFGRQAGAQYVIGTRDGIRNDKPVIPARGVNAQGSGDMYPKGGNMLHTIRQVVGNDSTWRDILRGLQRTFRHQTVNGQQIRDYISQHAGIDLSKVFQEYQETTMVPELDYRIAGGTLSYRWSNVVKGFDMPVGVTLSDSGFTVIHPTEEWQQAPISLSDAAKFRVDPDYYVTAKRVE